MSDSGFALEKKLAELRRLDCLRQAAAELRAKGLGGIAEPHSYSETRGVPLDVSSGKTTKGASPSPWWPPGDMVETALIMFALRGDPKKEPKNLNTQDVLELNLQALFKPGDPNVSKQDNVPVLKAAAALEALSSRPNSALSTGAMNCYYRLVYAINAAGPDQLQGGVTSGAEGAPQTAFMTWRCARAIEAFAKAFESTAEFISILEDFEKNGPVAAHELWKKIHQENRKDWAHIAITRLRPTLLMLELPLPQSKMTTLGESLAALNTAAVKAAKHLSETFGPASKPDEFMLDATAAKKAHDAIQNLLKQLNEMSSTPLAGATDTSSKAVAALKNAASGVRGQLLPTHGFFRAVLDHELVSSTIHPERVTDVAELIFAGAGASRVSVTDPQAMDQQTMTASLNKAVTLMTNNGRVPSHKPFDVGPKGYVLNAAAAEALYAFAELATRINYPVSEETAQRMFNHFTETWRDGDAAQGWRHERDNPTAHCHWWLSAVSVEALQRFIWMLDGRINQIVFADLHVIDPKTTPLKLSNLFYPDYGLVAANVNDRVGIAKTLSKLHAHLWGASLGDPLYTAILFGPPGTGKTTLVEALAKSANLPMVEITPSDIVLGGEAEIETRARALFAALAMLTDTVILFDEFDRVLKNRNQAGEGASTFQFLTPGMLPKLKTLHDRAKEQRSVFILSTNLIGSLDPAAVRQGRFDTKVGVYPPDILSRAGRLDEALAATHDALQKMAVKIDSGFVTNDRRLQIIEKSAGRGMTQIAKPNWFTANSKKPPADGTPLWYLSDKNGKEPLFEAPEKTLPKTPTADYPGKGEDYPSEMATIEWLEWSFVILSDELIPSIDAPDLKALLETKWGLAKDQLKLIKESQKALSAAADKDATHAQQPK